MVFTHLLTFSGPQRHLLGNAQCLGEGWYGPGRELMGTQNIHPNLEGSVLSPCGKDNDPGRVSPSEPGLDLARALALVSAPPGAFLLLSLGLVGGACSSWTWTLSPFSLFSS